MSRHVHGGSILGVQRGVFHGLQKCACAHRHFFMMLKPAQSQLCPLQVHLIKHMPVANQAAFISSLHMSGRCFCEGSGGWLGEADYLQMLQEEETDLESPWLPTVCYQHLPYYYLF